MDIHIIHLFLFQLITIHLVLKNKVNSLIIETVCSFIIYSLYAQVEERLIEVNELRDASEVFCTGTAVVVSPVGSISLQGERSILCPQKYKYIRLIQCHRRIFWLCLETTGISQQIKDFSKIFKIGKKTPLIVVYFLAH